MPSLIVDSDFESLDAAVRGLNFPDHVRETLALVDVDYVSYDDRLHRGQVVIHRQHADDVRSLFASFLRIGFKVFRAVPVSLYSWSDDLSMTANNSSAFNYRFIKDTDRLSNHSFGTALDLNPAQNPYILNTTPGVPPRIFPEGAVYDLSVPGTVTPEVVTLFRELGWKWGGDWETPIDYQHFEKPIL